MPLIKLYIKGSKDIALASAKKRGIDLYNLRQTDRLPITIAEVMDYKREAVVVWHGENTVPKHDLGWPDGTLLMHLETDIITPADLKV